MQKTPIVIGGKPVGRFKASWLLFKESFRFLRADKEMLWLPIITAFISLGLYILLCLIAFLLSWGGSVAALEQSLESEQSPLIPLFVFGTYAISAFTLALSQAGIAHIVHTRVRGGDATLGQGLRTAFSHSVSLLLWAVITSTVGLVLRAIAERSGWFMRIFIALIGATWSVVTYFVVPAMVIGNTSAFGSIGRSAEVFKRTWGETLISTFSLGTTFMGFYMLALLTLGGLAGGAAYIGQYVLAGVLVVALIIALFVLSLVQATLNGVLRTLLYIYAAERTVPANFNPELLEKMLSRRQFASETLPVNTTA